MVEIRWTTLEHPPYSYDLFPSDYHNIKLELQNKRAFLHVTKKLR